MIVLDFFKNRKRSRHEKVSPQKDLCYCQDCGELVENRWYISRCSICGIKLKSMVKDGEIIPEEKFCHNCGSTRFEAEIVSKINCIDINYAVLMKTVIEPHVENITQSWLDRDEHGQVKLITQT